MADEFYSDDELSQDHIQNKGNFHGCYLLVSKHPKFTGKTYIGYTVNPNRRIKQHNGGAHVGGAKKTSGRGPWDMILIVHGFPSDIAALRFEWAWQNPAKSRRIGRPVCTKKHKESALSHKLKVLAHMLTVPPWCRLPLTLRWLKQEYESHFHSLKQPPVHMPFAYGLVDIQSVPSSNNDTATDNGGLEVTRGKGFPDCGICGKPSKVPASSVYLSCYHKDCSLKAHVNCLAAQMCEDSQVIPISGVCPGCKQTLLWGELVQRHRQEHLLAQSSQANGGDGSQPSNSKISKKIDKKKKAASQHWSHELHVT